jgi:hypothetical protein
MKYIRNILTLCLLLSSSQNVFAQGFNELQGQTYPQINLIYAYSVESISSGNWTCRGCELVPGDGTGEVIVKERKLNKVLLFISFLFDLFFVKKICHSDAMP